MTPVGPPAAAPRRTVAAALRQGLRTSWLTLLLIAATNTGFAAVLWVDDARPFWHPLVTCQLYGFAIAYCVNVAQPWDRRRPLPVLALAVAIGALIGVVLVIVVKGYAWDYVLARRSVFAWNIVTAFANGLFVSLFFLVKQREARAEAALHKAEAARHLASRQAVEAELKMMQAQVEPHFLFNTLASVQYLTETDPPQATRLLGHLLGYLRAALPQLRSSATTLGQEVALAESYLGILQARMGPRLAVSVDVPESLRAHPFPPVMLITLVENAIQHGVEPAAAGGTDHDPGAHDRIAPRRRGRRHRRRHRARRATGGPRRRPRQRTPAPRRAVRLRGTLPPRERRCGWRGRHARGPAGRRMRSPMDRSEFECRGAQREGSPARCRCPPR